MRRLAALLTASGLAGAVALTALHAARAQNVSDGPPPEVQIAPAQNLEEMVPPAGMPRLTIANALGGVAHVFPAINTASLIGRMKALYFGGDPPLVYHSGGSIMPKAKIISIFWVPPTLQNGGATSMSAQYQSLMKRLSADYPGHGIDNNNTQYFQTIGRKTTYINNSGSDGGFYVDTSPYPASGCTDSVTPGNCITDAQVQAEIQKVMGIKHWGGGLSVIFMLYTSSGEGSCLTAGVCAYTYYCAYHGYIPGTTPVIYANMPYGNAAYCQEPGEPSPNNNVAADTVMTAASHEITEAITDPLLNAWFTAGFGFEIGDLCAYDYGTTNTWDSGKANQSWNGHFYLLQTEFDNHAYSSGNGCVQAGPYGAAPSSGL